MDNQEGKSFETETLLDTGSFKADESSNDDDVLNYIAKNVANEIKSNREYSSVYVNQLQHVHVHPQDVL